MTIQNNISQILSEASHPITSDADLTYLMDAIGDSKYVLLGEASHGTHEYYTWRAKISQRLIEEKGFNFIAVEGDWPNCYQLNRYIKNYANAKPNAYEALLNFKRWPTWMWANWEIVAFSEWLKSYNMDKPMKNRIGFFGLDIYSLWESLEVIIDYLKTKDLATLKTALKAIRCFEPYKADDGQSYAKANAIVPELCTDEVVKLLWELRRKMPQYDGDIENAFNIEQNALISVNAEKYYRAMLSGGSVAWNIRDWHMNNTLDRLMKLHGKNAKCIVWEHNTHIGDARATNMTDEGMINLGQLINEEHLNEGVFALGFGSYKGSVIAGRKWSDVMRKQIVPPAINNSWEYYLHNAGNTNNRLILLDKIKDENFKKTPLEHRAIGVVYNPEYEQYGNYVPSILTTRYNAFFFIDETSALHPLHITPDGHQLPETFPFGI
jgi:erythromycin esterase-like protein